MLPTLAFAAAIAALRRSISSVFESMDLDRDLVSCVAANQPNPPEPLADNGL